MIKDRKKMFSKMQEDTTKCHEEKLSRKKLKLDSHNNVLMILFIKLLENFPRNIVEVPLLTVGLDCFPQAKTSIGFSFLGGIVFGSFLNEEKKKISKKL